MKKYLVLDIGGSAIKYGIVTGEGEILSNSQVVTPQTWEEIAKIFDRLVTEQPEKISGVAISAPGRIDVEEGVIHIGRALPYLDHINFKEYFKEKYNLPASLVNDGKAAGQAELWLGNLKGVKNAAAIALGTGIGGSMIVDGKVIQGRNFMAGEFSYVLPTEELLMHNLAYTNSAVKLVAELADVIGLEDKTDGQGVFEVINSRENEEVNKIFAAYCKRLAIFMCNLQATLDISHVVIGGGISNQPILIEELNHQYNLIRENIPRFRNDFEPLSIDSCKFSSNANLLGALYQLLLEQDKI